MKHYIIAAVVAASFMALSMFATKCGNQPKVVPPKPDHLFDLRPVCQITVDIPCMDTDGKASVEIPLRGAFMDDFYLMSVVFPDEMPPNTNLCMDVICEVFRKDTITVTAYNCSGHPVDPPPTSYVLKTNR